MNPAIIIPTFHVAATRKFDAASSVFDHPIRLNQKGDLARCLESLEKVQGLGQIIVIAAAEDAMVADQAAEKVQEVCNQFPSMHTLVIGRACTEIIIQRLKQMGFPDMSFAIGLRSYSAVRNLGLVVSNILGFDATVFIDDDEVIEDPEFLIKAMYGLGKLTKKGIPILAKSGYYLNAKNSYHSLSQNKWYNHWWQQGKAFNAWIDKAMRSPRLSRSNHVCGGCLALHKESYRRVAFDPWIVRGEDMDYLLDLRMYGSDIWFDNQWSVVHLPPSERNEGHRFRRDIFRWLYEYRKVEFARSQIDLIPINPASLMPYPGPFLEPGIEKRIKRTAWLRSLSRPDREAYRDAARVATTDAAKYAEEYCHEYFEFIYQWAEVMKHTEQDRVLARAIVQAAIARQRGEEVVVEALGVQPEMRAQADVNMDLPEMQPDWQKSQGEVGSEGVSDGDASGSAEGATADAPAKATGVNASDTADIAEASASSDDPNATRAFPAPGVTDSFDGVVRAKERSKANEKLVRASVVAGIVADDSAKEASAAAGAPAAKTAAGTKAVPTAKATQVAPAQRPVAKNASTDNAANASADSTDNSFEDLGVTMASTSVDPGQTGAIRLDLDENE